MIDHLSFPHIVDAVFESAPFESLVIMTAVCRGWRSRALAQIGHLYIDMDSNTYRYPFSIPLAIAARQCRLLDIDTGCPVAYYMTKLMPFEALVPPLDTIRVRGSTYLDKPMWFPTARRVVFSAFQSPKRESVPPFECGARFGGWETMEKLVIVHKSVGSTHGNDCHSPSRNMRTLTPTLFPQLKEVVLIMFGDGACSHCITSLLDEASDMSVPVTLAINSNTSSWYAFRPYKVEGNSLVKIEDYQKCTRQGVAVLSHEEYRSSIGSAEYTLETDREPFPHWEVLDLPDQFRRKGCGP